MNRPNVENVRFTVEDDEDLNYGSHRCIIRLSGEIYIAQRTTPPSWHVLPIHEALCGVQFGDDYRYHGPGIYRGLKHNLDMLGVCGLPAYESNPLGHRSRRRVPRVPRERGGVMSFDVDGTMDGRPFVIQCTRIGDSSHWWIKVYDSSEEQPVVTEVFGAPKWELIAWVSSAQVVVMQDFEDSGWQEGVRSLHVDSLMGYGEDDCPWSHDNPPPTEVLLRATVEDFMHAYLEKVEVEHAQRRAQMGTTLH